MTLETISGALILFFIILIPLVVFTIGLIAYSVNYYREKRKEVQYYAGEHELTKEGAHKLSKILRKEEHQSAWDVAGHGESKTFVKHFDGEDFIEGLEVEDEEE